ncbi:hypothetical protein DL765_006933 [Monosporascus sp. GIB2]|nr:hypothetical protein DL765_006933 [Monosporascus sp. GIB2]
MNISRLLHREAIIDNRGFMRHVPAWRQGRHIARPNPTDKGQSKTLTFLEAFFAASAGSIWIFLGTFNTVLLSLVFYIIKRWALFLLDNSSGDQPYSPVELSRLLSDLVPKLVSLTVVIGIRLLWAILKSSAGRTFLLVVVGGVAVLNTHTRASKEDWWRGGADAFWVFAKVFFDFWGLFNRLRAIFTRSLFWCFSLPGRLISRGSPTEFEYPRLQGENSIRLFRLHRRLPFRPLSGTLIPVPLEDAPPYEAISYSWGDCKETSVVIVNGVSFKTSKATYDALASCRSFRRSRLVWIDYLCIDQGNLDEKSKQVQMMAKIYERARLVIAHLGNHEGAFLVYLLLFEMVVAIKLQGYNGRDLADKYSRRPNPVQWQAFIHFLTSPWFSRVWVIQEVAFAKILVLKYGNCSYNWDTMVTLIKTLMEPEMTGLIHQDPKGWEAVGGMLRICHLDRERMRRYLVMAEEALHGNLLTNALSIAMQIQDPQRTEDLRQRLAQPSAASLTSLLQSSVHAQASNPRDKVYALLNLAYDRPSLNPPIPDYNLATEEVYLQTARFVLSTPDQFTMLSFAGIGSPRQFSRLPSWVPDWTSPPKGVPLTTSSDNMLDFVYHASGSLSPIIQTPSSPHSPLLTLAAIFTDKVIRLGPPLTTNHDDPNNKPVIDPSGAVFYPGDIAHFHTWHTDTISLANSHVADPYPYKSPAQSRTEAFWRTLIGDNTSTKRPAPTVLGDDYAAWVTYLEDMNALFMAPKVKIPHDDEAFWARHMAAGVWGASLARCASGRRLCVTKKGFLGCVSAGGEVGDRVVVVKGARTPFLVREKVGRNMKEDGGRWGWVGACYLHGSMDGEAVEGKEWEMMTLL